MAKSSKQKSVERIFWYVITALVILAFLGIVASVLHWDFLKVRKMELNHSIFYERSDFLDSLEDKISGSSGLLNFLGGDSIIFWEIAERKNKRELNPFPYIEDLRISSNFWERHVVIETTPKKMRGVVCSAAEECYAFDKSGKVYGKVANLRGNLIFKIHDENKRKYVPGHHFLPKEDWVNRIFETVKIVKEEGFEIESVVIRDINLQEWKIDLEDGPELRFSLRHMHDELGKVLTQLSTQLDWPSLQYVNLKVPNRVYYQ